LGIEGKARREGVPLLLEGEREDLEAGFPLYAQEALPRSEVPDYPVVKMNVFVNGDLAATQELFDLLAREVPELDFNIPLAGFLNITPKGYSKASGIDILCEALGIGLDQVVTFGDGGNDLEMIAHVPNGVAVAGAVPEVAAAAHWHIGPCEEDAVPAAIEALAAGEWPFER
jgi:hydroxymethylpyrimidine pyrophosphatase-like HAD family hydrolase